MFRSSLTHNLTEELLLTLVHKFIPWAVSHAGNKSRDLDNISLNKCKKNLFDVPIIHHNQLFSFLFSVLSRIFGFIP